MQIRRDEFKQGYWNTQGLSQLAVGDEANLADYNYFFATAETIQVGLPRPGLMR